MFVQSYVTDDPMRQAFDEWYANQRAHRDYWEAKQLAFYAWEAAWQAATKAVAGECERALRRAATCTDYGSNPVAIALLAQASRIRENYGF
jgi:ferric-dicitrate binding protein FerR (iron transport regulator)